MIFQEVFRTENSWQNDFLYFQSSDQKTGALVTLIAQQQGFALLDNSLGPKLYRSEKKVPLSQRFGSQTTSLQDRLKSRVQDDGEKIL